MKLDSKIFVTGHNTVIGHAIVEKLTSMGYSNIITTEPHELNLNSKTMVDAFFNKETPNVVFLCSGINGGIEFNVNNPALLFRNNVTIQNNLIHAANVFGVENLVYFGSSCMYPANSEQPIKEESLLTGLLEPTSEAYSIAKIAGLMHCKAYNNEYKSNKFIVLVPPTVYGPYDVFNLHQSHVIPALIMKLQKAKNNIEPITINNGTTLREFIYSDDVADAAIFAVNNISKLSNTHYNIGTGHEISIYNLAKIIADKLKFVNYIYCDNSNEEGITRKLLESSKFQNLGWKPSTSLFEGISKTCEWYLENNRF